MESLEEKYEKAYSICRNNPRESIKLLNEILDVSPKHLKSNHDAILIYLGLGKYEEAIEQGMKYIGYYPQDCRAYNSLGLVYYAKGEYKKAISYLHQSVEKDDEFWQSYNNLGTCFLKIGDIINSKKNYEKSYELNINDSTLIGLIFCNLFESHYLEAERYFSQIKDSKLLHKSKILMDICDYMKNNCNLEIEKHKCSNILLKLIEKV